MLENNHPGDVREPGCVVSEGQRLIDGWLAAKKRTEAAERELCEAKDNLQQAVKSLGAWLVPDDAKAGEHFCVWYGDSIVKAYLMCGVPGEYVVSVRDRGRSLTGKE